MPGYENKTKRINNLLLKSKLVVGNEAEVRSNSSGETASDSGRGASEDEIHLTILAGGDGSYRKCQVSLSPDFEDFLPPPPYCFADQVDQLKQIAYTSTYPKPRAPKKEGPSASLHNISKYTKDHKQIPGTVGHIRKHPLGGSSGRIVYKPADADISEYPTIELSKIKSAAKGYPF
ncbi:hypothetical protein LOTGIDRAFT_153443 [Lottia gigantea]|uniref:Uncharacterized protein n=1 Tax=Lottia gigantea TaxID=225164 RepID=V4BXY9_LOTGI|nr:hypothetical protein LOTGIDRAFT_153443 [Lottia gigantea]ESO93964.1 hypothetical protein LOTGIDRAFT_153443 [Lottia gigantea]